MCARLTSKICLGVTVCSVAVLGGGCQSKSSSMATLGRGVPGEAAPMALAANDGPTVSSPPPIAADVGTPIPTVSQADVIAWVTRGTTDDVILDRIQHARTAVPITAGDEMRLRDAGVTDEVIRAMKASAWN